MAEIRSGIAIDPVELVYAGFLEALLATRHLLECSDIRRYHQKVMTQQQRHTSCFIRTQSL